MHNICKKAKNKSDNFALCSTTKPEVKILCNSSCHTVDRFMLLLPRLTFEAWFKCLQEASFQFWLKCFPENHDNTSGFMLSPSVHVKRYISVYVSWIQCLSRVGTVLFYCQHLPQNLASEGLLIKCQLNGIGLLLPSSEIQSFDKLIVRWAYSAKQRLDKFLTS